MDENEPNDVGIFSVYKYKCSFAGCYLEFRRKDRLDSHEYTHNRVKKFKCTEENCDKAYTNNAHLQRHKKTAHSKSTEIVQCSIESCEEFFYSIAKMKAHCREIHSDKSREYECEICNEKFRRKTKLKEHMFAHTGTYKYTCDKCGKGFLQLGHLQRHEHSHRIRKCELCDATFDKWSLLLVHKQTEHSNIQYNCSICNKEFHSKRGLRNHRKIHSNVDDRSVHQCPFENCSKSFSQRNNMLAHYKSKHENRKFACTFDGCKSELSTKQKLDLHIKVMHLDESIEKPKRQSKATRTERKDKGVQKISTASKLFNIILPSEFEKAIISGQGKNIHIDFDRNDSEVDDQLDHGTNSETKTFTATNLRSQGAVEC